MNSDAGRDERHVGPVEYGVLGLGVSGRAAIAFLRRQGYVPLVFDTRDRPPALDQVRAAHPELVIATGEPDPAALARCRRLVVSPGVSPDLPALAAARAVGCELVGEIELFARHARAPVIAITGTNGKSTVTTLVAAMLAADGVEVRCGGNLGPAALDLLEAREPECYVLELSSFQLELTASLAPEVAAILNLAPDHLDRHADFDAYVAAKARILTDAAHVVLNADDEIVADLGAGRDAVAFSLGEPGRRRIGLRCRDGRMWLADEDAEYVATDALALVGAHNHANALAAIAIARTWGVSREAIRAALTDFRGLPHRAEPVAEVAGVQYVDDSKATNPGAAVASIVGLLGDRGGVVIAGGEGKEASFESLADAVAAHAHTVVLIGRAAGAIEDAIGGRVACIRADDLEQAVRAAQARARPGERVLLAPACASFDMFTDYAARGEAFRAAVRALEGRT